MTTRYLSRQQYRTILGSLGAAFDVSRTGEPDTAGVLRHFRAMRRLNRTSKGGI